MRSNWDTGIEIRRLRTPDKEIHLRFMLSLDAATRRSRYCGVVNDEFVVRQVDKAWDQGSVIHGAFLGEDLVGVAELFVARDGRAEAAFAVRPDLRNLGIGTRLMEAVVLSARNRGVGEIVVLCLPENAAMRRLAKKVASRMTVTIDEVEGTIHPSGPTALSFLREIVHDWPRPIWLQFADRIGRT